MIAPPDQPPPAIDSGTGPRLRPEAILLDRGSDLQVGIDPGLVIPDPDGSLRLLLQRCDGRSTRVELADLAAAHHLTPADLDELLEALAGLDLLTPPQAPQPPVRIRLIGAGRVGSAVGHLLLTAGVDVLYVADGTPPDPDVYPHTPVGTQAEAYRARVAAAGRRGRPAPAVVAVNHWSKPDGIDPALTVLVAESLEVDRAVTDGLTRSDQPHLLVRPMFGGAVVGPLVVPGRTACVRCTDLTRRDADPGWPGLVTQLSRVRPSVDDVRLSWTAGTAVAQVLGFLRNRPVDLLSATLELGADLRQRWRSWSVHPGCGCGWAAPPR